MNGRKTYEAPTLEDLGDLGSFVRGFGATKKQNDGVVIKKEFLDFSV